MKKCFAQSKLTASVGALLSAAVLSSPAQAVNISTDGLGDVGLIPYYTVRNNIDTNLSVVNTSEYVVAFKIRFREGANSRDARDFNVFLSPYDVWVATVTMGDDGQTPEIRTADTTCTAPWISGDPDVGFAIDPNTGVKRMRFTNLDYRGGPGTTGMDRAQEGHVEIIEMGVADPVASDLAALAVHGSGQDCAALSRAYLNNRVTVSGSNMNCHQEVPQLMITDPDTGLLREVERNDNLAGPIAFKAEFCEPLNVLKVAANLIRVDMGVAAGVPVTTLANFFNDLDGLEDAPLYANDLMDEPSTRAPSLGSASPKQSVQLVDGRVISADFINGPHNQGHNEDTVSSLFMATDVVNEYGLGGAALAQTSWVLTFPTKYSYTDPRDVGAAVPPFPARFTTAGGAPVLPTFTFYDREEQVNSPGSVLPSPPPSTGNFLPWETMTLDFFAADDNATGSGLFGSQHSYPVVLPTGFTSGWVDLQFSDAGNIVGDDPLGNPIVFEGLPVIGFSLKVLENGVAGPFRLNYGNSTPHAYFRDVR